MSEKPREEGVSDHFTKHCMVMEMGAEQRSNQLPEKQPCLISDARACNLLTESLARFPSLFSLSFPMTVKAPRGRSSDEQSPPGPVPTKLGKEQGQQLQGLAHLTPSAGILD